MYTAFIEKHSFNLEQIFFEGGALTTCIPQLRHWQSHDSFNDKAILLKLVLLTKILWGILIIDWWET